MEQKIRDALTDKGKLNIGFPGGNLDEIIYSNGDGKLWCAFGSADTAPIPRRWNAFGVFDANRQSQVITVEINIPTQANSAHVAGFFARDPASGRTYLMHDGGVGGGRRGIGRNAFLAWSKTTLVDVAKIGGLGRPGIVVGDVNALELPSRLWRFVRLVNCFKKAVSQGNLNDGTVLSAIAEWDRFNSENSGRRCGTRTATIDYVSYHGDVVQLLYEERKVSLTPDERVLNSPLIDLYVRSGEKISEIYEVKTSLDRQSLYTAIGQLITHSVEAAPNIKRVLVIPKGEIASDLQRCIQSLSIDVRRFAITTGQNPQATLVYDRT